MVKVNSSEASGLFGVPTARRDEAMAAAQKLRELAGGDGHVGIVTRGADGVVVAAPDGALYEGVLYVRGRYPVASGDAFLAGLVVALDGGIGWGGALRLALGAATANAELPGAGRLDRSRAEALAERATVRLISKRGDPPHPIGGVAPSSAICDCAPCEMPRTRSGRPTNSRRRETTSGSTGQWTVQRAVRGPRVVALDEGR